MLKDTLYQKDKLQEILIEKDAKIEIMSSQLKQNSQPMDIVQLKSEIEHLSDKLKAINDSQIANSRQLTETNLQFEGIIKKSEAKCDRFTSELRKLEDKNATELDEKNEEIAQLKEENNRLQKMAEKTQLRLKSVEAIFHKLIDIIEDLQKKSQQQSEEVVRCEPETYKIHIMEQQSEVTAETDLEELPYSPAHQDNSSQIEVRSETISGTSQPTSPISDFVVLSRIGW